jgi:hypothetical protein
MGLFRRHRDDESDPAPQEPSLEEIEENPELLAAESAVNDLPPPPPQSGWFYGSHEGMVTFPGPGPDDDPAVADGDDSPAGEGPADS